MSWHLPTDPCPECGSTDTVMRDFVNADFVDIPVMGRTRAVAKRGTPQYTMACPACGHSERIDGIPEPWYWNPSDSDQAGSGGDDVQEDS